MNEDKATRYHRQKRRAALASLAWIALVLGAPLLAGFHLDIRDLVDRLARNLPVALGSLRLPTMMAAYLAWLGLLEQVASLPLSFYSGYILEHRYQLSTQSVGYWCRDYLKAGLLGLVLATIGLSLLYAVIERWPDWWWAIGAGGLSLILIGLINVGPVLLLPLFYRFKPLENRELRDRLVGMAERAGTRVVEAYEWTLADRTKKANAALTGLGRTRRILVSDTLLRDYSDAEIEVVLAHEMAHHAHHDLVKGIALETLLALVAFAVADRILNTLGPAFGLTGPADVAGLPLLLLAGGTISCLAMPIFHAVSRANERAADRFALMLTQNPSAFVSTMRRLGAQNLSEENPSPLVRWIFYSHPPLKERIASAGHAEH